MKPTIVENEMSSAAHDWFRPRLRALVEEAGRAGFGPDIAVAVVTDLMNGPEFSAGPVMVDEDWNRDPGAPEPQPDRTDGAAAAELAPDLMTPQGIIPVHNRGF